MNSANWSYEMKVDYCRKSRHEESKVVQIYLRFLKVTWQFIFYFSWIFCDCLDDLFKRWRRAMSRGSTTAELKTKGYEYFFDGQKVTNTSLTVKRSRIVSREFHPYTTTLTKTCQGVCDCELKHKNLAIILL